MDFIVKQASNIEHLKTDCLIIPVTDQKTLSPELKKLDKHFGGVISRLDKAGDLHKGRSRTALLHLEDKNYARLLLVGCGKKSLDLPSFIKIITAAEKAIKGTNSKNASLLLDSIKVKDTSPATLLQHAASIFETHVYHYDETLSHKKPKPSLKKVTFITSHADAASKKAVRQGKAIAEGVNLARQLGNLPANICTPSFLANEARAMGRQYEKLTTKVISEAQLKKLGMNAMLSVTAGSEEPPKFIIMEYKGGKASEKPYVLVGKGVTFDSGGISIKPGARMDEMKYDMCGAASVFGTMHTVCELGLGINLVGVVGAVENMPSGKATKPGDVITSMSGQTIEILNTDAEGRLVLCDALTYVERYKPKAVIDIATLTGACVVALGSHASAVYSKDESLCSALVEAGQKTHDRCWPMPLWEDYDHQLKSNFADMANIGGPSAGSVTAACFLARFTKKYTWAHLDIAGSAWNTGNAKGATGRPVGLLSQYLIDQA